MGTRKAHAGASQRAQQYLKDVATWQRHTPSVTNDQVKAEFFATKFTEQVTQSVLSFTIVLVKKL
jgi:hypothetical protein